MRTLSSIFYLLSSVCLLAQPQEAWVARYNGGFTTNNHTPLAVKLDDLYLRYGELATPARAGIVFTFTNANMNGYTGSWDFFFVQVGLSHTKHCVGTNETRCRWSSSGLDGNHPYVGHHFGAVFSGEEGDSPAAPLQSDATMAYKDNQFDVYLMFQPTSVWPSKEVPLKVASWGWSGTAIQTNGSWVLVNSNYPASVTGADTISFPQWTNNIENTPYRTNSAACQCP